MLKDDENSRMVAFAAQLEQGASIEDAGVEVKKRHPIYGDPHDISTSSGEDRPQPYELRDRVNRYIEMRVKQEDGFQQHKRDLEASSSFNAFVRSEIKNGRL